MMKRLYLVRHAKAAPASPSGPDVQRPLQGPGRRDAPKMGKRLHKRGVSLDLLVSSPAVRACATAELIARQLDYERENIIVDDRLYPGAARDVLAVVQHLDDALNRVMVVAHNPGLSELAQRFCPRITALPTCAIVQLTFDTDTWSTVDKATLIDSALDSPKSS